MSSKEWVKVTAELLGLHQTQENFDVIFHSPTNLCINHEASVAQDIFAEGTYWHEMSPIVNRHIIQPEELL